MIWGKPPTFFVSQLPLLLSKDDNCVYLTTMSSDKSMYTMQNSINHMVHVDRYYSQICDLNACSEVSEDLIVLSHSPLFLFCFNVDILYNLFGSFILLIELVQIIISHQHIALSFVLPSEIS